MKFWEALREMQENGKTCKPCFVYDSNKTYHWGDVMDFPCLKDNKGSEVQANASLMNADWRIVTALDAEVENGQ